MARQRRWLPRLLLFSLILIVLPVALAPLLPLSPLKPAVESRLSATLGRKVSVGSIRLSFWGGPYLTLSDMTAKEDPAFGSGDFLKADQVRADFSIRQYALNRQLVIEGLRIKSADFTFVKNDNGAWSWTTIGQPVSQSAAAHRLSFQSAYPLLTVLASLLAPDISNARFNNIVIENASVKLVDKTGAQPPESLYKNISLRASIAAPENAAPATVNQYRGDLRAESNESDGAELLKAELPFDLSIDRSASPALVVKGTVGPGPLETKNFSAQSFKLDGQLSSHGSSNASGKLSSGEIFIRSVNVSEQVASALRINQIGDMNPGTGIGSMETDFRFEQDMVRTNNLRIQQLDGLGDATADQGWFKVEAALTLNYAATVLLSPEATAKAKASNPMIGLAVTILQNNDRVAVPVSITGDVRNPQVQVDVSRIF